MIWGIVVFCWGVVVLGMLGLCADYLKRIVFLLGGNPDEDAPEPERKEELKL